MQLKVFIFFGLLTTTQLINAAVLKDIHIEPMKVVGGQPISVTVSLDRTGVEVATIRSSYISVVNIPEQTFPIIDRSNATKTFNTSPISGQSQFVSITAELDGVTKQKIVEVTPTAEASSTTRAYRANKRDMSYLLKIAQQNGFVFQSTAVTRRTGCAISADGNGLTLEVARPSAPGSVQTKGICRFTLFGGRNLAPDFIFDPAELRYTLSNAISRSIRWDEKPERSASAAMVITAENGDQGIKTVMTFTSIGFVGPMNRNWADALE